MLASMPRPGLLAFALIASGCSGRTTPASLLCDGAPPLPSGRCPTAVETRIDGGGLPDFGAPDVPVVPDLGLPPDGGPLDIGQPDTGGLRDMGVPDGGIGSPLEIDPRVVGIGPIKAGTRATLPLRVENRSSGAVVVETEVIPEGSAVTLDPSALALEPFGVASFQLVWAPESGGPVSGQVLLDACGGSCPAAVDVSGLALDEGVQCGSGLDLGEIPVGECTEGELQCQSVVVQPVVYRRTEVQSPVLRPGALAAQPVVGGIAVPFEVCPAEEGAVDAVVAPVFEFDAQLEAPTPVQVRARAVGGV